MSYQTLYRKWRPTQFDEVKGQDHIVKTLKNQIKAQRIGHAYLFCGTRGTGKTTVAKIFAKAVNCEHPVDGSPCNACEMCKKIQNQTSMNVIEIDAASNNGVDNIREIREEVSYPPTEGKYKVYIIDEVHMLSAGAFNALLKTLEEPPSYVIFILATTEPQRIPVTILSRCQRYDFKRISIDTIAERLQELIVRESLDVEEKAVRYIARAADGSMRDALSLLDQCAAFYMGKKLTYEQVLEVLGAVDTTVFSQLLRCIDSGRFADAVRLLDAVVEQGRDLTQFVTDFIWYLRNLLLARDADGLEDILDISSENLQALKEEAQLINQEKVIRYIRVFSELSSQMRYSSQKRVLIEMALVKLCQPSMEGKSASLEDQVMALSERVSDLERKMASGKFASGISSGDAKDVDLTAGTQYISQEQEEPASTQGNGLKPKGKNPSAVPDLGESKAAKEGPQGEAAAGAKAKRKDLELVCARWNRIVKALPVDMGFVLKNAKVAVNADDQLMLQFEKPFQKSYFEQATHREVLQKTISQELGKNVEIVLKLEDKDADQETEFVIPNGIHLEGVEIKYE